VTFPEFLFLLVILVVAAIFAYIYVQRRERTRTSPVTPYAEGLRAVLDGDRMKAIQKLREVVAADTGNVDAYLRLGVLFAESGDPLRAVKIHRGLTFRADLSNVQKIEVYRALAEDYVQQADPPRALEMLELLLSLNKKDRRALERKVDLLVQRREWSGAFDTAQRLAALSGPVTPRFLAVLKVETGLKLCEAKKERDGRIQFREAIKYDNSFIAPYLLWGDSYVRENRAEDAVRIWRRMISANAAQAHLVFERLETCLFELGRFSEIEQIYRALIRSYPQNVHAYAALSRFLDKRGDRGDAISVLTDGLHHNPESLWLRRLLVQIYSDIGDDHRAVDIARDILSRVMKAQYEFTCSSCGYVATEPTWLCPRCQKLDTFNV
jgi:lipopolysaccharide biosynthesis regulator YciM